jgi:hypothetical protein
MITFIALGTVPGSTVQCGSLDGAAHTGIGAAIASDTSYLKSYGKREHGLKGGVAISEGGSAQRPGSFGSLGSPLP